MWKNKSLGQASRSAFDGLRVLVKERSAKREIVLIFISFILLLLYKNIAGVLLVVISVTILAFEAINTAVEMLCDHITPTYSPVIKSIKDLMASAIFVMLATYLIALIIFFNSI